jgi:hypothetical protein
MELEQMDEEQVLSEAMKQGFNPEYDGENKKSPKEYLEVAFNHNKVLKERNDKLSETVEKLTGQMSLLVEFQNEQKQKAVEKAITELKAERREAISDGDHDKVEKIDEQIDEQKVAKVRNDPILDAWIGRNAWYKDNEDLGIEADIIAQQLKATGRFSASDQDYERLLNRVESKVRQSFPDKFKNPKKDNPPDVDPGNPSPLRKSKNTYADLPADAKLACDQFVKNKLMSKEQYMDAYEWD